MDRAQAAKQRLKAARAARGAAGGAAAAVDSGGGSGAARVPLEEQLLAHIAADADPVPVQLLRKYIAYARAYVHPVLSDDAKQVNRHPTLCRWRLSPAQCTSCFTSTLRRPQGPWPKEKAVGKHLWPCAVAAAPLFPWSSFASVGEGDPRMWRGRGRTMQGHTNIIGGLRRC